MEPNQFELKSHVTCPICNKDFKLLSRSHLKNHGLTLEEFKEKYPGVETMSEVMKASNMRASLIRSKLPYDTENFRASIKVASEKKRTKEPKFYDEDLWDLNPERCKHCGGPRGFAQRYGSFCKKKECVFASRAIGSKFVSSEGRKRQGLGAGGTPRERKIPICHRCNKSFERQTYRQRICKACKNDTLLKKRTNMSEEAKYRSDCKFKFALHDYPEEFDFSLIERYGWYKAKNRGDNLNGVSRDHMISVKFGYENNIPAEIISHPANCQLLRHSDNVSKYSGCSITLEELYERIRVWDKKYLVEV